ncbi:serine/threonine-protein kinase [Thermocoleostomius sinensis]|uniref:non-specific serine/threonine protein kinase n=1 Tax=Thermocoleostomius sinensis A174 TaxID=2016057 RepID=A0A9E8ZC25_9CYAN|nr:serine/threonine-protein kinase [Thermocoleostomius sinensis]WAL58643.1 serine/threonine-protein kinase [Thermocoleostomius sinensis A174]
MELYCTRPTCPRPLNRFSDLDDSAKLKAVPQKFCTACGMPQILVGRYMPLRLLGRGGFGAAFLARDRYTPMMRQCVVKQFQPAGNLTPSQLEIAQRLFEREAEVLESLGTRHPQIPNLLAFFELDVPSRTPGETERFFYLVQEFIDGLNMEDLLEQKRVFSEAEVTELLTEILKVLKFVHENGSIHRDIKPSNIMRHRDGRYYLLDFGAVKQVTTSVIEPKARRSTGIYSKGYAPPEQVAGSVVYPATDLYALAVTCITLLTGKQPPDLFDPLSNSFQWRSHIQVSDRLGAILDRLLLAAPNQRFQSAEQVLDALTAPPAKIPPPPPIPPTVPFPPQTPPRSVNPPISPSTPQSPSPNSPSPLPTPHPPAIQPRSRFSLVEFLGGAAFTGFEGGLVALALLSLLGTSLTPSFWLILAGITGGMILAQNRRWIERVDLVIIAVATFAIVTFVAPLNQAIPPAIITTLGSKVIAILLVGAFVGLAAIVVAIVFRLIYNLLSRLL